MSLISTLKGKGQSGFGAGSTAEEVAEGLNLSGKTYLITGCTSGLGAEAMRVLIERGARVLGTARNQDKAAAACAPFGDRAIPLTCELSEPASVRGCVEAVRARGGSLDGILANAGIMALPELTVKHGLELQFLTNHMGHFLLVTGLLSTLTPEGRVVVLSSSAHNMAPKEGIEFDNLDGQKGYSPWKAYGQSKLANLLFAKGLARRLPEPGQTANAVHPGVINTGLQRSMNPMLAQLLRVMAPLFLKSVPEGAATEVFALTHPGLSGTTGEYFADCNVASSSRLSKSAPLAEQLWETSVQLSSSFG
jgi:WW domain-containing oxidoreductase